MHRRRQRIPHSDTRHDGVNYTLLYTTTPSGMHLYALLFTSAIVVRALLCL